MPISGIPYGSVNRKNWLSRLHRYRMLVPKLDEIQADMPAGYRLEHGGTDEEAKKGMRQIMSSLSISGVLIYFLLVIQFNSVVKPFMILLTLPLAAGGGLMLLGAPGIVLDLEAGECGATARITSYFEQPSSLKGHISLYDDGELLERVENYLDTDVDCDGSEFTVIGERMLTGVDIPATEHLGQVFIDPDRELRFIGLDTNGETRWSGSQLNYKIFRGAGYITKSVTD